jgi:hypothetical protein
MLSDGEERPRTARPLTQRLGTTADAAQVADALEGIWREIEGALTPIVGKGGVTALYKRSLHLTASVYPWMLLRQDGVEPSANRTALKLAVARQAPAQALAGGNALLEAFHDLLGSLVGASLTDRLLRSVWAHPAGDTPAQDISP